MWIRFDAFTLTICLTCCCSVEVLARQFSKCEFAQTLRNHFAEEEIAAWTCIAQFESEFKTDAINPSNSDGSSDHGIFQINDRYWCGRSSGSNACGVECAVLRQEDLTESIRCAQIVKDKQGFTAWAVWPRCKGQTATYLDECNDRSFLPPTIFDIQVRPANRGPGFNQTRITSALKSFQQARNQDLYPPYNSLNDSRSFNLSSIGAMDFIGGGRLNLGEKLSSGSTLGQPPLYQPVLSGLGGMNFLGGVQNSFFTVNGDQSQRNTYSSPGYLRNSGGMGFLGFPATRFSFGSGSQLPVAGPTRNAPPKLNNLRYSGLLNTMTLIGHAYDATTYPAPVKGLMFRRGQGILANQGAMNFLGGIQGIAFRRTLVQKPSRTVVLPPVRPVRIAAPQRVQQSFQAKINVNAPKVTNIQNSIPLAHFGTGSLLDQIAPNSPRTFTVQSTRLPPTNTRQLSQSAFNSNVQSRYPITTIPQSAHVKGPILSYSTGNIVFSLGAKGSGQAVQANMPGGYGGVSFTTRNGVMTMVKHYG
ncbi:uncharacterized protein LOC100908839 [Galendromus occidentalis]|uniref:lysozyme n=1 Tax=Galendromus occidentalis TaxID=34638 RepID=A0AAJ6VY98_9ACAR|nr:uncharacterized protein LOC100908839 [Galendromus occidentalis]